MAEKTNCRIFGIIGGSLDHSLSPQIHNHFFRKLGLDSRYHAFPVKAERLRQAMEGIRALGIKGVNVTLPFKEEVIPYLDKVDKQAEKVGAVNTILNDNGELIGYNTDVFGIHETIERKMKLDLDGKTAVILGAGGAARAALSVLLARKVKSVFVFNRTKEKAQRLLGDFSSSMDVKIEAFDSKDLDELDLGDGLTLVVNATSAPPSLTRRVVDSFLQRASFSDSQIFDLNYAEKSLSGDVPPERYIDGLYMLASQAAESFYVWTGIKLDPEEVYDYVRRKANRR